MRPSRVFAVAVRDLRQVHAGRRWYRLPLLALGLLLPVGGIRLPSAAEILDIPVADAAGPVRVDGEIPPALASRLELAPGAMVTVRDGDPVVVEARAISARLRAALDTLPGEPRVEVLHEVPAVRYPGRSLLVAVLAISLLTGPLAESIPGERSRGTLEVLLSAALSRGELVAGKILAWTLFGTAVAGLAAAGGALSGVQTAGAWMLALPLAIATAVAFGLWLVRGAADVVGGAVVPMRVLPPAAMGMAGLSYAISSVHPALAGAVPLGGPLLVVGEVLEGPGPLLGALVGTAAAVTALGWGIAREVDQAGRARRPWPAGLGAAVLAAGVWWLAVAGPGVWAVAGNPDLSLPEDASLAAGGMLAGLLGLVIAARDGRVPGRWAGLGHTLAGVVPGALLAGLARVLPPPAAPDGLASFAARLNEALAPTDLASGLCAALGTALLFRGVLQDRLGLWTALVWTAIVAPFHPALGLASGLILAITARRLGLGAAMIAQVVWVISSVTLN